MMFSVCPYFQVHQPFRVRKMTIFDIGKEQDYFDEPLHQKLNNRMILQKVANKCYLPANKVIKEILQERSDVRFAFSFSGTVLEQCEHYAPEVIQSFQELTDTGQVEILAETYYHSLASLYSMEEFAEQVRLHTKKIQSLFSQTPAVFRNTELIYSNQIAQQVHALGYDTMLAEGWDHYLRGRSPNFVYHAKEVPEMKLLLKNYKLSDDIAFRFSNKNWEEWPLTVSKFSQWINTFHGNAQCMNLFMDYETFGEHQWVDTGIFDFLRMLPNELLKHPDTVFQTPGELAQTHQAQGMLDVPYPMSWADMTRDVTAWTGNAMQQECLKRVYAIETVIKRLNEKSLIEAWRRLQTSDHFYYMCTKWFADGDVHAYFNPYESPYEAYMAFMNALQDMEQRIGTHVVALQKR